MREQLRGTGLEPVVLVLSHPWFGADEDLPLVPHHIERHGDHEADRQGHE